LLTSGSRSENIRSTTAEFYVNQATIPLGVAVFTCSCGGTRVQYDLDTIPSGWTTAPDGTDRCPRCANADGALGQLDDDRAVDDPDRVGRDRLGGR